MSCNRHVVNQQTGGSLLREVASSFAKATEDETKAKRGRARRRKAVGKWARTRSSASLPRPSSRGGRAHICVSAKRTHFILLKIRCIALIYKNLCRLQWVLQMGSFWKNEPIFGGLWGRFQRKMGSFHGKR